MRQWARRRAAENARGRVDVTLDWTLDAGHWTLDAGHWTLDTGHWTLDTGHWTLDTRHWTLDTGYWTLDTGYPLGLSTHCLLTLIHITQPTRLLIISYAVLCMTKKKSCSCFYFITLTAFYPIHNTYISSFM